MHSAPFGGVSTSLVSVTTETDNLPWASFLVRNERAFRGRTCLVLPLYTLPFHAPTSKSERHAFCKNRKLLRVGTVPQVSHERSKSTNACKVHIARSVATDQCKPLGPSAEEKVYDVILRQAALMDKPTKSRPLAMDVALDWVPVTTKNLLDEAYERCGKVCAEYAKTFYLGTLLMTPDRRKAIWAIYVWCRRTDELVDGPNASQITPTVLDHWEQRLEKTFQGCPYDMLDAALTDTILKFPVDIQPFRDLINGMRMDLTNSRYVDFDQLYLYCYYVAGTVGLMSVPVMGIDPVSKAPAENVYNSALALGIANQLTNILRDVGEDASRGRIYLPQDELHQFGLSDDDIFAGIVTDKWRAFMKDQIKRARIFFKRAASGVLELHKDSRWPVWASLLLYEQILDSIEANDYNNFTTRAYVSKWKKLVTVSAAYVNSVFPPRV